jgi:hypothetical protein
MFLFLLRCVLRIYAVLWICVFTQIGARPLDRDPLHRAEVPGQSQRRPVLRIYAELPCWWNKVQAIGKNTSLGKSKFCVNQKFLPFCPSANIFSQQNRPGPNLKNRWAAKSPPPENSHRTKHENRVKTPLKIAISIKVK